MLKSMPESGTSWEELKPEMVDRGSGDAKWRDGKTAVYVFNAGEDVAQVQKEGYTLYMSENGLGPLAFPSLKQMEEDPWLMERILDYNPRIARDFTDFVDSKLVKRRLAVRIFEDYLNEDQEEKLLFEIYQRILFK